jgi:hypothetical protein
MRYLILLFFLVSNCQQEPQIAEQQEKSYLISELDFNKSNLELKGAAMKKALEWNEYQSFVTGMENYDHSVAATVQLQEAVNEMVANPNAGFTDLPIMSRIKIVQTRLGIYSSFLNYSQKSAEDHLLKFNDIITAYDQLKAQMNIKFNEDDVSRQQLIDQLNREKRQDAQREKSDSLNTSL